MGGVVSLIGGLFGGGGAAQPQLPPPPPPPPQLPAGDSAAAAQRQRTAGMAGLASTIATSPQGVTGGTNTTGGAKALLGQ